MIYLLIYLNITVKYNKHKNYEKEKNKALEKILKESKNAKEPIVNNVCTIQ